MPNFSEKQAYHAQTHNIYKSVYRSGIFSVYFYPSHFCLYGFKSLTLHSLNLFLIKLTNKLTYQTSLLL